MRTNQPEVTRELLLELFNYDPETGVFIRKINKYRGRIGDVAGCVVDGYIRIIINYGRYKAHRLAWLYVYGEWPDGEIDHINRNKSDNRISNLRIFSRSQNCSNKNLNSNNSSGIKGVHFDKESKKWRAVVMNNWKRFSIGRFSTKEEAQEARAKFITKNFDSEAYKL